MAIALDEPHDIDRAIAQRDPLGSGAARVLEDGAIAHVRGRHVRPQYFQGQQRVLGDPHGVAGVQAGAHEILARRFDQHLHFARLHVARMVLDGDAHARIERLRAHGAQHDFGKDVIPGALGKARVIAYDFRDINDKQARYWRDVGTIDAFYEANMDLIAVTPEFNLYDRKWPIRTRVVQAPPAKFVFAQEGRRMGVAVDSIVAAGCIVSGGRVVRSVLSTGVRVNSYCEVEYSILMPNVKIGRNSRVRRAIIDSGVEIPDSSVIGYDAAEDRARGYTVTDSGIVVVPGGLGVEREMLAAGQ